MVFAAHGHFWPAKFTAYSARLQYRCDRSAAFFRGSCMKCRARIRYRYGGPCGSTIQFHDLQAKYRSLRNRPESTESSDLIRRAMAGRRPDLSAATGIVGMPSRTTEFGLDGGTHLAHFVQENRSHRLPARIFNLATAAPIMSLFMARQFAFEGFRSGGSSS